MSKATNFLFFFITIFLSLVVSLNLKSKIKAPYVIKCTPVSGYTQFCSNHRFDPNNPDASHYLVDCTPQGGQTQTYTVNLNSMLTNNNGNISWGNYNGFGATCVPCGFTNAWSSTLNCVCNNNSGGTTNASIDLNTILASNGGQPYFGSCQNVLAQY